MNCFPCFRKDEENNNEDVPVAQATVAPTPQHVESKSNQATNGNKDDSNAVTPNAKTFTFRELATATKHFRQECLLSEGGSGRVFKATLQSGQIVAVKQLDKNSTQGNKDFLAEVTVLSLLHHPNLLTLIGYCADGDQRLLVYEYLAVGSVEDHLLDPKPEKKRLDWATRMKIANGAAEALEYLHEKANPPVIYRDLKSSNIMLDEEFNPKLSDYGLAKLGGNNSHVTPRVMGNYGYCAPEYERSGELTVKSDVYSFGVILLELITGRRALDTSRPTDEQNLVSWAQPFFKDPKRFPEMADPLLENAFPVKSLNQAVGVAAMCLQDEPDVRPFISDVVAALSFLAMAPPEPSPVPVTPQAPVDNASGDVSSDSAANNPTQDPDQVAESVVAKSEDDKPEPSKDNDEEDQDGSDYESGESYESSEYEDDEDFTSYEQGTDDTKEGNQLEKEESIELEFEVASMSSSEDESQPGKISRRHGSKTNNSLKLNRKSTKKSNEGSGSGDDDTWHESSSPGNNSQRGSDRLSSRGSSMRSKSRNVDSNGSQKKSRTSKNRSVSTYKRDNSGNKEPGKRRSKSAYYKSKKTEEKEQ